MMQEPEFPSNLILAMPERAKVALGAPPLGPKQASPCADPPGGFLIMAECALVAPVTHTLGEV